VQSPTSRRPAWLYPTTILVVFTLFVLYGLWVALTQLNGRFGPYLSPFSSPEIHISIRGFQIPPGLWIGPFPLAFRLTCYYYRKAYFRAFLFHPRSCAVSEPHRGAYYGERRFWIFNNLHRYALYLIIIQTLFLAYDAIVAFSYQGAFHFGLGNVILVANVACLVAYTYGCHALRHLVGGSQDCFSCHRARYRVWKGVTRLNVHHEMWAWISMFTVWGTDIYVRLLINGVLPHGGWN
ncbi:MAG: hypothetical protein M3024_05705, partial [Candidatus Dormibacteraeota bacterium]|nr:hypothetical protein [Candidatus Dormibacteraeota bacterium]